MWPPTLASTVAVSFFVEGYISGQHNLVDMGAKMSVLPPSCIDIRQKQAASPLHAGNDFTRSTFGRGSLTLGVGL